MQEGEEDVIRCVCRKRFEVDVVERWEGEQADGLVGGRTLSEDAQGREESWGVGETVNLRLGWGECGGSDIVVVSKVGSVEDLRVDALYS